MPLLLLAIIAVGAIVRVLQIGSKGLWLDEAFSVWVGWQSIPEALSWLIRIDQHPPLYYLLLHFWMRLGDDAATVRALSALLGTLTIPVIYVLGQRLMGRGVGLLAALILALSPFHVRFAQEARMYALLNLNASLALLALVRLLTPSARAAMVPLGQQVVDYLRTWRTERRLLSLQVVETDLAWCAYVLFTSATVLTHSTAVFFPIAVNLFVFGLTWLRRRWPGDGKQLEPPSLRNWIVAQLGAFLLWSPWLKAFIVQATRVYGEFWLSAPTWETVVETIQNLLNAFPPQRIEWFGIIWAMYGALALWGVFHLRQRPMRLALLCTLFVTPFVGEWLVSLRRPIFYERTLIWASIPLYLLLAAGIKQLRYRTYVLTAMAILATINGLSVREYVLYFEKEQWDDAADYVAQRVEDRDLLLFHSTWVQIPFDFYFRDRDLPVEERGVPVDLFDRGVLEPKMAASDLPQLRALVRGRDRVWLIYSHYWYTDPQNLIPATLQETFELLDRRRFYGLQVRLYGASSIE